MASPNDKLPPLLPKISGAVETPQQQPDSSQSHRDVGPAYKKKAIPKLLNACDCLTSTIVGPGKLRQCDGMRPTCGPCTRLKFRCHYAAPQGLTARQADKQNIESYRSAIGLLREGSFEDATQALQRIRGTERIEDAVRSIAEARLLLPTQMVPSYTVNDRMKQDVSSTDQPMMERLGNPRKRLRSPYDDADFMFDRRFMVGAQDVNVDRDMFVRISSRRLPLSRWTTASTDEEFMNHLLNLFFTWDNIVEKTMYRPTFEEDLDALDPNFANDNPLAFCSKFLVNSLLALGSLYTLEPRSFQVPDDPSSRGRAWANEAYLHLAQIDRPSFPLLQGLLAMFCYEGVVGSGNKAVTLFPMAMETYRALNEHCTSRRQSGEAERLQRDYLTASWCLWGFYCTEWRASEAFGFRKQTRKPRIEKVWHDVDFPYLQPGCTGYWWSPYPMSFRTQKSMKVEIREADLALSEIVEVALDFLHPEEDPPPDMNPTRALTIYDTYIEWKNSCPEQLRFEVAVLPSVILLHIGVELLLISILRPFSGMTKEKFGRFNPKERCYAHASNLMARIWAFRSFAILRFEYWLTHALSTAAFIVVGEIEDEPIQLDTLGRACQCLHEMSVSLPLATDVLAGIHAALKRYKIAVPPYMQKYFISAKHRKDGLLHHSVAALIPSVHDAEQLGRAAEVRLQELLDVFEDLEVD